MEIDQLLALSDCDLKAQCKISKKPIIIDICAWKKPLSKKQRWVLVNHIKKIETEMSKLDPNCEGCQMMRALLNNAYIRIGKLENSNRKLRREKIRIEKYLYESEGINNG